MFLTCCLISGHYLSSGLYPTIRLYSCLKVPLQPPCCLILPVSSTPSFLALRPALHCIHGMCCLLLGILILYILMPWLLVATNAAGGPKYAAGFQTHH